MTKYREILRLASLGLSQQSIADSSGVSKKTVNRVLKRAKELDISWPLEPNETDAILADKFFPIRAKANIVEETACLTSTTSGRSCSATVSTKSSSGRSTWRNAASPAKSHSCIPSSAITSSRMSRNAAQPCTSIGSPANRSKLTGQEILQRSSIRIPARSFRPSSLWAS